MAPATPSKSGVNDNANDDQPSRGQNDRSNHAVANVKVDRATASSTTNEDSPCDPHRRLQRQPLTQANLSAHNVHASTAAHGPTPMQRWFMSADDIVIRGRTTRAPRNDLTRYVDRIFKTAEREKKSGGK